MQKFKSVYFADYPAPTARQKSLKLAFGTSDAALYERVAPMSSEDMRRVMGYASYADVKLAAQRSGRTVNAFCLARLRDAQGRNSDQLSLAGLPEPPVLNLDPIQATFRGGAAEPLHDWYPYLEGYSPEFVTTVLDAFAPAARRILDPFGGTGTTPIAVARRGGTGIYCELNPLLQLLTDAKAVALGLASRPRKELVATLLGMTKTIRSDVMAQEEDTRLVAAYAQTFGESAFFPPATLSAVLRLRSWLDLLDCSAPLAVTFATVAAVASLLPSSNLIRRGDVRFRKGAGEIAARCDDFVGEVQRRMERVATSIAGLEQSASMPLFIAADAKRLGRIASLNVDAVVTSPPYLNGTNYYRNTKLELWFLRALHQQADLARYRSQTVTAGINDVTVDKRAERAPPLVAGVVERLSKEAYDGRIPQMVSSYFADMNKVIAAVERHLRSGAPMLMDIGDSAYGGVHVDTPSILRDMLTVRGWRNAREVVLRKRLSRSGQALRQVLLIADAPVSIENAIQLPAWKRQWAVFKKTLPHQSGDFAKRNWGNPLHSLCSYQGKMKPSLAKHLIDTFVRPGDVVVDPFGGVGTIPFEAAMAGARSWSFDISPAAVPIAMAKLQPTSTQACGAVLDQLRHYIATAKVLKAARAEAAAIHFNGPLAAYFHPKTFDEILKARQFFHEHAPFDPARALVFAALLHVLHGNRPYALSRRSHPITPFAPTGEAEYKSLIEKVTEKVARALAVDRSPEFVAGHAIFQDATTSWPIEVDDIDAIVTSPPFFDSTRFYLANWMRLWLAGWSCNDFKERPFAFVDERQKQDFSVYRPILRQARERLKSGGVCVFHLGKSKKCDMAVEIQRMAAPWFARSEVFSENVEHCESHGIRDKGAVVEHLYLVLY